MTRTKIKSMRRKQNEMRKIEFLKRQEQLNKLQLQEERKNARLNRRQGFFEKIFQHQIYLMDIGSFFDDEWALAFENLGFSIKDERVDRDLHNLMEWRIEVGYMTEEEAEKLFCDWGVSPILSPEEHSVLYCVLDEQMCA